MAKRTGKTRAMKVKAKDVKPLRKHSHSIRNMPNGNEAKPEIPEESVLQPIA